ncbi:hypothetical protein AVEN_214201-1 [Araneus ventricosus]|uniref:Uncharacterized protein n=1 Tax=Araneus ventricosus TaxID=182803 RepID=A0A4Y2FYC6_ARAVE|nr:hypothetical protein AVEN_214201-1 [Araneus ventricosus]
MSPRTQSDTLSLTGFVASANGSGRQTAKDEGRSTRVIAVMARSPTQGNPTSLCANGSRQSSVMLHLRQSQQCKASRYLLGKVHGIAATYMDIDSRFHEEYSEPWMSINTNVLHLTRATGPCRCARYHAAISNSGTRKEERDLAKRGLP